MAKKATKKDEVLSSSENTANEAEEVKTETVEAPKEEVKDTVETVEEAPKEEVETNPQAVETPETETKADNTEDKKLADAKEKAAEQVDIIKSFLKSSRIKLRNYNY